MRVKIGDSKETFQDVFVSDVAAVTIEWGLDALYEAGAKTGFL
jgi:hypothetical protein